MESYRANKNPLKKSAIVKQGAPSQAAFRLAAALQMVARCSVSFEIFIRAA
jgi:hypothetical protein